jgi:hypothetical protein
MEQFRALVAHDLPAIQIEAVNGRFDHNVDGEPLLILVPANRDHSIRLRYAPQDNPVSPWSVVYYGSPRALVERTICTPTSIQRQVIHWLSESMDHYARRDSTA